MEYNNCVVIEHVKCIVLKVRRAEGVPDFSTEIFGRSLTEWVTTAMQSYEPVCVDYNDGDELLPVIRPHLDQSVPITVVLYSDTPLISNASVSEAVAQAKREKLDVLRMPRGWVLGTAHLSKTQTIQADRTYYFGDDDYVTVYNNNQLAYTSDILRARIAHFFMERGVRLVDPNTTVISADAVIEAGAVIEPFNIIRGKTLIKKNAVIGAGSDIDSSVIGEGAAVTRSTLKSAIVGEGCTVGPYAHLRPGAVLAAGVHIGDFVEIKNSRIGAGTRIGHLAYVGDAAIGARCNIGAGVVFANYDGAAKRRTVIGDNVFVGSNSTLIAPLEIGDGAFIAAASAITGDVNPKALAIARQKQVNKENWTKNPYANKYTNKDDSKDE